MTQYHSEENNLLVCGSAFSDNEEFDILFVFCFYLRGAVSNDKYGICFICLLMCVCVCVHAHIRVWTPKDKKIKSEKVAFVNLA